MLEDIRAYDGKRRTKGDYTIVLLFGGFERCDGFRLDVERSLPDTGHTGDGFFGQRGSGEGGAASLGRGVVGFERLLGPCERRVGGEGFACFRAGRGGRLQSLPIRRLSDGRTSPSLRNGTAERSAAMRAKRREGSFNVFSTAFSSR